MNPAIQPGRWVTDLAADTRYAFRTFRRQPGFAAVAVISLAAGIGLNTAVFSVINTIFFQSIRGVPEPDRVASIGGRVSFATFRDVRDNTQSLERVAAWQPLQVDIDVRGIKVRGAVPAVSEGYFAVMGIRSDRGQFFDAAPGRQPAAEAAVVLDYEFWTKALASDPTAIGETLLVSGVRATILGIAPRTFHGIGPERPALWMSMGMVPMVRSTAPRWDDPSENGWRIVARVRSGVTPPQVNAELRTLAVRSPALFPRGSLTASTGPERWTGPVSPEKRIEFLLVVVLPLVVVGLILWIGCSNVANLLLARAAARRKEIAIRLANGASRSRLIRQLLTESLLLAIGGGALGLLLAAWTLDFAWATLPEVPRLAIELDIHVLVYTALVCVVATLLFGLVPAFHATRVDVAPLLKGDEPGHHHTTRGARVRTFFLVTQFASSMALLLVAGTFVRTLIATHVGEQSAVIDHLAFGYVESGLDREPARVEFWKTVREESLRLPNVTSVTLSPAGNGPRQRLVPEGFDGVTGQAEVTTQHIDGGFFRTAGITLLAGHDPTADAATGAVEMAVVNERAARQFWRTTDVVGKRFALGDVPVVEIAGVMRDDGAEACVFRRLTDGSLTRANILVRTAHDSEATVEPLRALLLRLSGDRAFTRVSTLREAQLGGLQRLTTLALVVAALVLSLATVGLYGSISFINSQRTREIAIRMALGAPRQAVLRLLAREGVLVVAGGSALGLALTAIAFQFMSGMLFARWTVDPLTVAGVMAAFSATTLLACYLPGRRALRIDPMGVLRSD
jgi:predicted permease